MTVRELKELFHATNDELGEVLGRNPNYVKHTLADLEVKGRRHLLDGFVRLAELRLTEMTAALRALALSAEEMGRVPDSELKSLRAIIDRCNLFIGGNGNGNGVDAARTDTSRTADAEPSAGSGGGG